MLGNADHRLFGHVVRGLIRHGSGRGEAVGGAVRGECFTLGDGQLPPPRNAEHRGDGVEVLRGEDDREAIIGILPQLAVRQRRQAARQRTAGGGAGTEQPAAEWEDVSQATNNGLKPGIVDSRLRTILCEETFFERDAVLVAEVLGQIDRGAWALTAAMVPLDSENSRGHGLVSVVVAFDSCDGCPCQDGRSRSEPVLFAVVLRLMKPTATARTLVSAHNQGVKLASVQQNATLSGAVGF